MGLFDLFKKKRIDEAVSQSVKLEKTVEQTTQFDKKKTGKCLLSLKKTLVNVWQVTV